MCFDRALYVAAYFCQNMVSQQSGCTCLHLCLLHWPEAWIQWKSNCRLVHGIIKTMGDETQELFSIGPGSWWRLEQLVFLDFSQSMTRDQGKCASLGGSLLKASSTSAGKMTVELASAKEVRMVFFDVSLSSTFSLTLDSTKTKAFFFFFSAFPFWKGTATRNFS